jgi:UPF0716 family protein affecting phage T7 exclusion
MLPKSGICSMINSIFFQILSSWEVIAAIVAFMIILPITFYIASHDKNVTLEFVGMRKKKKKKNAGGERKENGGEDAESGKTERRKRLRNDREEDDTETDEEKDKRKYELLKRLKAGKSRK